MGTHITGWPWVRRDEMTYVGLGLGQGKGKWERRIWRETKRKTNMGEDTEPRVSASVFNGDSLRSALGNQHTRDKALVHETEMDNLNRP